MDIWRARDLSHNILEAAMRDAELEGVGDKVDLRNADVRWACREIARVLKSGGVALISDFTHTDEYATVFREQGLEATSCFSLLLAPMILRIVKACKPRNSPSHCYAAVSRCSRPPGPTIAPSPTPSP